MNISSKLLNMIKGIGIFVIVYTIISGNGDDTFWGWILMFVSLILTILFLDESKNKLTLLLVTLGLSMICSRGFWSAFPWLLISIISLFIYYIFGCNSNMQEFQKNIMLFLNKKTDRKNLHDIILPTQWSAFNILNPFEHYYYFSDTRELIIKKGIPPFRKNRPYPISEFVDTRMINEDNELIFWCSISIPLKYNANSANPTHVILKHIKKSKYRELYISINGISPR